MTLKTIARLTAIPALLAGLAITGSALAGGHGGSGGYGASPMKHIVKQLDLSDDQKAIVKAERTEAKSDREADRAEMEEIRSALHAELTKDNPSESVLNSLIDRKAALKTSSEKAKIGSFLALQATFTPEQQAEFVQLMAEAEARKEAKHAERKANRGKGQGQGHDASGGDRMPKGQGGEHRRRGGR